MKKMTAETTEQATMQEEPDTETHDKEATTNLWETSKEHKPQNKHKILACFIC